MHRPEKIEFFFPTLMITASRNTYGDSWNKAMVLFTYITYSAFKPKTQCIGQKKKKLGFPHP